jgi:predicted translation initiation factor SUI1
MKLNSLADLKKLLPDSNVSQTAAGGTRPGDSKRDDHGHDGRGKSVRIYLDTKGRKGKTVTIVAGLHHNPDTKNEIAKMLKEFCGCGGTVKEGNIELQGDQRARAGEKMKSMNYVVN